MTGETVAMYHQGQHKDKKNNNRNRNASSVANNALQAEGSSGSASGGSSEAAAITLPRPPLEPWPVGAPPPSALSGAPPDSVREARSTSFSTAQRGGNSGFTGRGSPGRSNANSGNSSPYSPAAGQRREASGGSALQKVAAEDRNDFTRGNRSAPFVTEHDPIQARRGHANSFSGRRGYGPSHPNSGPGSPGGRYEQSYSKTGRSSPLGGHPRSNASSGQGSPRYYVQFTRALLAAVREKLEEHWTPDGRYQDRIRPDGDEPTWEEPEDATATMRLGTRTAEFITELYGSDLKPDDKLNWKRDLVEVQVLPLPQENVILISSNKIAGNNNIAAKFPNAESLRDCAWKTLTEFVKREIKAPEIPVGESSTINNNSQARRAAKLLKSLPKNAKLIIVPNPDELHAETVIEKYVSDNYPEVERTGPPTGTRPPCLGCVLHMNDPKVDALRHYEKVERKISAGPLFTNVRSGLRAQYVSLGLDSNIPPDRLPWDDYHKLIQKISSELKNVRDKITVVGYKPDISRIPRSASSSDPTTPDLNTLLLGRNAEHKDEPH